MTSARPVAVAAVTLLLGSAVGFTNDGPSETNDDGIDSEIYSMQDNPLAPFDRLVGGRWVADDGTYSVYSWGLGHQSIKVEMYFVIEGNDVLVSEGLWFWHPGEKKIRGYHTAVEMPVNFFDYVTEWEGDTMVNRLVSYGEMGGDYLETWAFSDADTYVWTLLQGPEGQEQRVMGGTWRRVVDGDGAGN